MPTVMSSRSKMRALVLPVLVMSCALASVWSGAEAAEVVELHGSGTTNPSRYLWQVMDLLEERSRVPIRATYRAVGSGTGQAEVVGQDSNGYKAYNHFGSGDVPMTATNYKTLTDNGRTMLHIPFAIGAISFFHSIPGVPTGDNRLNLTACLLSKIFQREIKTWDDPEILAVNPKLKTFSPDIVGKDIKVVHRALGSSSTNGATEYLSAACPENWKLGAGKTISWPEDTVSVQGSGGMSSYLSSNDYGIGYLDSGYGHSVNLAEIHLRNKAGKYLDSKEANISSTADVALSKDIIPKTAGGAPDPGADWSAVKMYDLDGEESWPIISFSYFYVDKNVGPLGTTGTLLKAFLKFVLSTTGQDMLEPFGFTRLPSDIATYNTHTVDNILDVAGRPWSFEELKNTKVYDGAGGNVISEKRRSYGEYQRSTFASQVSSLQAMDAAMMRDHDMMMEDHKQLAALAESVTALKNMDAAMMRDHDMMMEDHKLLAALAAEISELRSGQKSGSGSSDSGRNIAIVALCVTIVTLAMTVFNVATLSRRNKHGSKMSEISLNNV